MPILRFQGHQDDTFAELAHLEIEATNNGDGTPIDFLVEQVDRKERLVVSGQYLEARGGWTIGVGPSEPGSRVPRWPMHFEPGDSAHGPVLVIEAPDGVEVRKMVG